MKELLKDAGYRMLFMSAVLTLMYFVWPEMFYSILHSPF
jgi:hypothetical protein